MEVLSTRAFSGRLAERFPDVSRNCTFSGMLDSPVDVATFRASPSDWPSRAVELCPISEMSPFPSSVNREDFSGATPSATTLFSDYAGKMVSLQEGLATHTKCQNTGVQLSAPIDPHGRLVPRPRQFGLSYRSQF